MSKKIKIRVSISLLLVGFGLVALHFLAPLGIIQPQRVTQTTTPDELGLSYRKLALKTNDHLTLQGYWIKSTQDSCKGIMIITHGIGDCKENSLYMSKELAAMGIESIVFDSRAHGKSEGDYCTYGFYEKQDVSTLIDSIRKVYPTKKIGIWGKSMGGAIALQALALDKRLQFGIIESTFTSLDTIVYTYQKKFLFNIGLRPITNYALKRAGDIADFNPHEVQPIESVKNITQPILLIHGDADENISVAFGKRLFDKLASSNKELVIIPNGGHLNLSSIGGKLYQEKTRTFLTSNFKKESFHNSLSSK